MPYVLERVQKVREMRLASTKDATQKCADTPTLFTEDRAANSDILIIPSVSSQNRNIIPIGYYKYPTVCSNAAFQIADADLYLFGILNSSMHMAWVKIVAGRLKGDYRYSNTIVYNNFIFTEVTDKQREIIEQKSSV